MYMRERFHADLPTMPNTISMDVTEGAQWFLRDDERTTFYSWNEFPCLLPPAEDLWLEFLFPRQVHMDTGLVDLPAHMHSAAMRVVSTELEPKQRDSMRGQHYRLLKGAMAENFPKFGLRGLPLPVAEDSDTPPHWLLAGRTLVASKHQPALINLWAMTLDESGRCVRSLAAPLPWGLCMLALNSSQEKAQAVYAALDPDLKAQMQQEVKDEFEQPFFYCLALLNCRNIEIKDRTDAPAPILKRKRAFSARTRVSTGGTARSAAIPARVSSTRITGRNTDSGFRNCPALTHAFLDLIPFLEGGTDGRMKR